MMLGMQLSTCKQEPMALLKTAPESLMNISARIPSVSCVSKLLFMSNYATLIAPNAR